MGEFNLGSSRSYSIQYVIKLIFKKFKIKERPLFGLLNYRKDQAMNFKPSISKINKRLKWKPQYSLSKGLDETIKYFKKELKK